jgi:hypothetical protein
MRVNEIFEDKIFVSALITVALSGLAKLYRVSSNVTETNCEYSESNSLCSFFHLCETINNFVCDQKPYIQTNTHKAIENFFAFSVGFLGGYSILKFTKIFDSFLPKYGN